MNFETVIVRDISGRSYLFPFITTVNELMRQLQIKVGIPIHVQTLTYAGLEISTYKCYDKKLSEMGIKPGNTINITIKMIGG